MNDIDTARPGFWIKTTVFVAAAAALLYWAPPPVALAAGILYTLLLGHPFARWNRPLTQRLLQACVVLLGFGMDLPAVLRLGLHGSVFAAATITATLLLGAGLGRLLKLERRTTLLISAGTAICGGSAIAAVSSVIAATETEIAVSIGTVFLLNAAALGLFPAAGHWLHLTQGQFGLWAGVAIHDISSVVGAGMNYGGSALATATAVKLSRTLWIAPLTFALALGMAYNRRAAHDHSAPHRRPVKATVPWFIGFFLLASLLRSCVPGAALWSPPLLELARHGMILVLFLIGTSLSIHALRTAGWRAVAAGLLLWLLVSTLSLLAICTLKLAA